MVAMRRRTTSWTPSASREAMSPRPAPSHLCSHRAFFHVRTILKPRSVFAPSGCLCAVGAARLGACAFFPPTAGCPVTMVHVAHACTLFFNLVRSTRPCFLTPCGETIWKAKLPDGCALQCSRAPPYRSHHHR